MALLWGTLTYNDTPAQWTLPGQAPAPRGGPLGARWPTGRSLSTGTAGPIAAAPLPLDRGTWGPALLQGHYTGERKR